MSQFTTSNLRGNTAQLIHPTTGAASGNAPAFVVASCPRAAGVPSLLVGPMLKASEYHFETSQESDCLLRAACEPMSSYTKDPQRGALVYEPTDDFGKRSHRVELTQEAHEIGGDFWEMDALSQIVESVNADFGFAFFYVCGLLAPKTPLPADRFAGGWVDLDDVAAKIGYDVSGFTAAQREMMRAEVWKLLLFGARAVVIGQRKNDYRDKTTGEIIETRVESPVWRVHDIERPTQTAMFGETPRRVQLVISKQWEPLLTAPHLAQYLPFAEIVGSIPTNQTAGAWARVIGMALANFWRRLPHEATGAAPAILPTRSELLTRYTPKANTARTKSPLDILKSDTPKRAVKYWRDALAILREKGFISDDGEAARTVAQMLAAPLPKYKWQDDWLMEAVDLRPGAEVRKAIEARAAAKPVHKPRRLNAPKRRAPKPK